MGTNFDTNQLCAFPGNLVCFSEISGWHATPFYNTLWNIRVSSPHSEFSCIVTCGRAKLWQHLIIFKTLFTRYNLRDHISTHWSAREFLTSFAVPGKICTYLKKIHEKRQHISHFRNNLYKYCSILFNRSKVNKFICDNFCFLLADKKKLFYCHRGYDFK